VFVLKKFGLIRFKIIPDNPTKINHQTANFIKSSHFCFVPAAPSAATINPQTKTANNPTITTVDITTLTNHHISLGNALVSVTD
jgi:acyl-CoA hydrolase